MAYKLEIIGNYFVMSDTTDNTIIERPAANLYYRDHKEAQRIFFYYGNTNQTVGSVNGYFLPDLLDSSGVPFSSYENLISWLRTNTAGNPQLSSDITVNSGTNELARDAWGRQKVVHDRSLFHGMFSFNVPVSRWYETVNGVVQTGFINSSSVNGALVFKPGATLNDTTVLRSYRCPRYQPNRGHLYSTALICENPNALSIRRWGTFTKDSGVFFSLESGVLYGVVRTTRDGVAIDDKRVIDTTGIDLSKGNTFDYQYQWRGVGNYLFFINLQKVLTFSNLGTLTNLSMSNPANPAAFEAKNLGDNPAIILGCVDITSEGGDSNGRTYGSVGIENESGSVSISGYNVPVLAIRNKLNIGALVNTRDVTALLASAYGDQKAVFRVWTTRDNTAITLNNQSWMDYGDAHLEYVVYDNPNVATPITFDTTKAQVVFGCRVNLDETYSTSALFEGRTEIILSPGDTFIFTMHRENGLQMLAGISFEFCEEI